MPPYIHIAIFKYAGNVLIGSSLMKVSKNAKLIRRAFLGVSIWTEVHGLLNATPKLLIFLWLRQGQPRAGFILRPGTEEHSQRHLPVAQTSQSSILRRPPSWSTKWVNFKLKTNPQRFPSGQTSWFISKVLNGPPLFWYRVGIEDFKAKLESGQVVEHELDERWVIMFVPPNTWRELKLGTLFRRSKFYWVLSAPDCHRTGIFSFQLYQLEGGLFRGQTLSNG